MAKSSESSTKRTRAPQGEGDRLRPDLIRAATALLVESGNPEHVTLRAVARSVGIAAPSIYLHFADRDALLSAVMFEAERKFVRLLEAADPGPGEPAHERLRRIGLAYIRFAARNQGAYQVLFNGLLPAASFRLGVDVRGNVPKSFSVLLRVCAHATEDPARPAPPNNTSGAMALALELWSAIHGYVTLKANMVAFPWPSATAFVESLVKFLPPPPPPPH